VAEEYLKTIRDSGDAVVVACGLDEVSSMYRGVAATLRKARTGLLLAPRSAADGDVFATRLPRSVGAAVPAGRAILLRAGSWEWVQVPLAGPPS
jgi:S-DNA-T family DNA segregation ATPase FtsK/SpoIIIE